LQRKGVTSNQDLSQKRAENVMEYLISQGVQPSLVSAVGHGEADPVAPNNTAKGRAKNRRVELTLGGPAS
jgi:chemotaxis protein MotB